MLEELLGHLNNWFVREIHSGTFSVQDGMLLADFLRPGQYYRVFGSIFSDGLHQWPDDTLTDETFNGTVWALAVPPALLALADEIAAWRAKNPDSDKLSESVPNYSYTRAAGPSGAPAGWQAAFAARLNQWRKL